MTSFDAVGQNVPVPLSGAPEFLDEVPDVDIPSDDLDARRSTMAGAG